METLALEGPKAPPTPSVVKIYEPESDLEAFWLYQDYEIDWDSGPHADEDFKLYYEGFPR